ncbi:MAG TPA: LuxR C-terminal-related transcriptional regulator [Clostridiales bacterium]|nr:LuxR C-terminal-related transcriptional regulator [Clostridiales bacterium]
MKAIFQKTINSFLGTFRQEGVLNINKLTKKNLPFFVSWIAIILWLDFYILPIGTYGEVGKLSAYSPMTIFTFLYPLATTASVFLLDLKKFLPFVKYSAIVGIIGILINTITSNTVILYIGTTITAIAMGNILASIDYGFFMVMNNLERLYSVSIGIFISKIMLVAKVIFADTNYENGIFNVLPLVGFLPILICAWLYGKTTEDERFEPGKKTELRDYTVLILACFVFLFNDFLAPALWRSITSIASLTLNTYHVIGVLLGIVITLFLHLILHCNICYILNFSFAILTMGFVINAFGSNGEEWILLQVLLFGVSYSMGFVSIYYMMGIIAKKSRSIIFFRVGIFSVAIFYILGSSIISAIKDVNSAALLSAIALISVGIILIIFTLTPLLTKILHSAEWLDDLYRSDVTHTSRLTARLTELKLTPREIEVCVLLLDGYTMRQISSLINIAYSTVNTYCTSIYRKLGINSRTELVVMFSEYAVK